MCRSRPTSQRSQDLSPEVATDRDCGVGVALIVNTDEGLSGVLRSEDVLRALADVGVGGCKLYARAVASATDNEVLDETLVEKALRPVATLRADLRSGKKRAEGPSSPEDISRLSGKPLPEVDRTRATDGARSSR